MHTFGIRFTAIFFMSLAFSSFSRAQSQAQAAQLAIMPLPAQYRLENGQLPIDQAFSVKLSSPRDAYLDLAVARFLRDLSRQTGMTLQNASPGPGSGTAILIIRAEAKSKPMPELGEDESYRLKIAAGGAELSAPNTLGVLRGLQTFLQLVQPMQSGFAVPAVTIEDKPRFPWRGLMIDVARHFMPMEVIKRNLDGLAAVKLNVFHWHLSDNQGFRVESKEFPKLQERGSDGRYYTQQQVREVIAYAQERGIRVVPEFDIPGHSTAWFVGYPELASGPGPYQIERQWGVFDPAMDPTNDDVYKFLDKFIGEMARLFPDRYFHIGGDEVNGKQWDANPKIQEWMRAHGMKTNEQLQTYFTNRVQKIVEKHGKTMVGWDEILNPDSPKSVVIQSWRGQKSLADAARQGYRGLLSTGYYVDLNWPAAQHYAADPLGDGAADLTPEQKQRVLGGEACMWAEYVSPENIDSRIWPRTAAIAERLWSPQNVTDVDSMYARMEKESARLDFLGLTQHTNYGAMLRRIADGGEIDRLKVLADVVEPVKDYDREKLAKTPAVQSTPLNRLIDAARPESDTARRFGHMVDALVAGKADDRTRSEMRSLLAAWQENRAALQPMIAQSFLLAEDAQLSQNLSALGAAGLAAMDYLQSGRPSPESWRTQQLAEIAGAKQPNAQLLLVVAGQVEKLVQATAAR